MSIAEKRPIPIYGAVDGIGLGLVSDALVDRIMHILENTPMAIHGAVVTDLVAVWLARQQVERNTNQTDQLRDKLLRGHVQAVRDLVDYYDRKAASAIALGPMVGSAH
jgi:hypothetical protein